MFEIKKKRKKQNKTEHRIGSCHSGDHIARDHIYTDISTCIVEKSILKDRIGMVSNMLLGGWGMA